MEDLFSEVTADQKHVPANGSDIVDYVRRAGREGRRYSDIQTDLGAAAAMKAYALEKKGVLIRHGKRFYEAAR